MALIRAGGRCGLILPSGIYSDSWSRPLRQFMLERCRWEWLFGIENRNKLFPIDGRFKFNPVIVEKGGTTEFIRTAFMRRNLEDWERAENIATTYSLAQIKRFSPKSLALLEIQSEQEIRILEKIYRNGVLLGDKGPNGWGIKYKLEFMMNTDAHLFPPRPEWEEKGYRPDEYSRWLLGDWRPIEELWAELGVDPTRPEPVEIELEDWLFDSTAGPERREAEAQFVHGHLLKPGDVARTEWQLRCVQPPYDRLPIARADIPPGVILSRNGDAWIRENRIKDSAFPLYVGKMISVANWAASTVQRNYFHRCDIDPDYLLPAAVLRHDPLVGSRVVFRDISNSTNQRSFVSTLLPGLFPCGNLLPVIEPRSADTFAKIELLAYLSSLVFDWATRQRLSGSHLNWHIVESLGLPPSGSLPPRFCDRFADIALSSVHFAGEWLKISHMVRRPRLHVCSPHERLRIMAIVDAVVATTMRYTMSDMRTVLHECDRPVGHSDQKQPKGFWRIDKIKEPELRHTVLTLVAYTDLESKIQALDGDLKQGVRVFLAQNHGDGWMLPETLCLADYSLGYNKRAQQPQPVARRIGPRFYDWQLVQDTEESWQECHLHARNLLGANEYARLISSSDDGRREDSLSLVAERRVNYSKSKPGQKSLFAQEMDP